MNPQPDVAAAIAELARIESVPLADRGLPSSTYDLISRTARHNPNDPALRLLAGGQHWDRSETWSYDELLRRINRAANLFAALGVEPGGVVGLMLPNTGSTYSAFFGAQVLGIANPVNPMLATEHIIDIFRLTDARVLLAPAPDIDADLWRKACTVAAALPGLAVVSVGGGVDEPPAAWVGDFDDLTRTQPDELAFDRRPTASDPAAYFHTGGTTGTPKVAVHTHANQVYLAWTLAQHPVFTGDAVILTGLPLFHVNAVHVAALTPFFTGRSVVSLGPLGYRDKAAMADFWRIVAHYRVTTFSAVPTVYATLPGVPHGVDISSLRAGIVGAAPLPSGVRATFESMTGVPMLEGYGLTEATCVSVLAPMSGSKPGAIGIRLPYQHIKSVRVDEHGRPAGDCELAEVGVLAIRGPSVTPGYLRAGPAGAVPDPTGIVIDDWLITGDLGRVDADGFVTLSGRARDVIIRGGHNIDARLVEESLLTHPDIEAAAVVARPDSHSGEVPAAYVVLRAGAVAQSTELIAWAATHAPEPAAAPKFLHTIAEIPVTAVGKVHKIPLVLDAVNRVVAQEMLAAQTCGDIDVSTENGRIHARVHLADSPSDDRIRALTERLRAYSFSSVVDRASK
ncbi:acyl-CoA synthetase [Nocardia rhizosphaerihabitans]|uniref:Long-chain-fatty-acid--CoA ligase n=1 Tax=Nocardia rhizosphaerihabitans TaxID=1691570 RepID=A0ABQ2L204_9NOCA|nr:acyl-CoA synthetase [Nocardia rhizosphaerihabitans]GGN99827.1 putative long-chain-fatty-acid--CoA ligase [Nocardia rhizosphaerihabitans]